jgi:hypothetical protein
MGVQWDALHTLRKRRERERANDGALEISAHSGRTGGVYVCPQPCGGRRIAFVGLMVDVTQVPRGMCAKDDRWGIPYRVGAEAAGRPWDECKGIR